MLFSRPYSYASLRLKFQISTCELAVRPAEEVGRCAKFKFVLRHFDWIQNINFAVGESDRIKDCVRLLFVK
jgi:hypothetical protein